MSMIMSIIEFYFCGVWKQGKLKNLNKKGMVNAMVRAKAKERARQQLKKMKREVFSDGMTDGEAGRNSA